MRLKLLLLCFVLLAGCVEEQPEVVNETDELPVLTGPFVDSFMGFGYRIRDSTIYVTNIEVHKVVKVIPFDVDKYGSIQHMVIGGDYFFITSGGVLRAFDDSDVYYFHDNLTLVREFSGLDVRGKEVYRDGACIVVAGENETTINFVRLEFSDDCVADWVEK